MFMYKHNRRFPSYFFAILLLYTSFVTANWPPQAVIIRSPKTNLIEFSAYANTESLKTYAQYKLDQIHKTPRPIILESLLEKSQREFLSFEPQRAIKTYKIIISHIHSFDWTLSERKIILYALFRMAQLETNLQKQKLFLQEAVVFGGDLTIDTSLFPPPLMQTYLNVKKSINYTPVDLKKIFPEHELILINGKVYSTFQQQKKLLLPYGTYRVHALSSSKQAWLKTLSLSRLLSKKVQVPYLIGEHSSCQQTTLNPEMKKLDRLVQVLFPNFCVWSSVKEHIKSQQSELIADTVLDKPSSDSTSIKNLPENLAQSQANKNKWIKPVLWSGGAVLFSALAFSLIKNNKKSSSDNKKPTTVTVGF